MQRTTNLFYTPRILLLSILFVTTGSCVVKKKFIAENKARLEAEAREMVLISELNSRKQEAETLIREVADFNRQIGFLEKQVADLLAESELKNREFGATNDDLRSKLANSEMKLQETQDALGKTKEQLQLLQDIESRKSKRLTAVGTELNKTLVRWLSQGIHVDIKAEAAELMLPNYLMFEPKGVGLSEQGRDVLMALASYLTQHPELKIEVQCHTDYELPNGFTDSWAWSSHRAQLICKTLTNEFNVNANQLTPVGVGEYRPMASNETTEGQQLNRRTVLVIK